MWIATANYTGALVIHAPACPLIVTGYQRNAIDEPDLLGVGVAYWRYGIAGARTASACQVIAG